MSRVIITKGLMGSGKSFWAEEFCTKNTNYIRVNRDALRHMRIGYWRPRQEDLITDMENACIGAALSGGYSVIIDATNLNHDRNLARIAKLKEKFPELMWEYKDFTHVPIETCIKQDLQRKDSVGEKVIREMYNKYLRQVDTYSEPDAPMGIIVDIDGTLAIHGSRSPYEWLRVGEDSPNKPIIEIVRRYHNTHLVILFSGRDSVCRTQTEEWLKRFNVPYDGLYMRPEGDNRKDTVIKRELFENYVRDKYCIEFVLDDRACVKRMWFEMGLTVLGVGDPDADF